MCAVTECTVYLAHAAHIDDMPLWASAKGGCTKCHCVTAKKSPVYAVLTYTNKYVNKYVLVESNDDEIVRLK